MNLINHLALRYLQSFATCQFPITSGRMKSLTLFFLGCILMNHVYSLPPYDPYNRVHLLFFGMYIIYSIQRFVGNCSFRYKDQKGYQGFQNSCGNSWGDQNGTWRSGQKNANDERNFYSVTNHLNDPKYFGKQQSGWM